MAKKISLIINSCNECPYKQWNSYVEEFECKLLDKLIFYDEISNKIDKEPYSIPIIHKDCKLEDNL
jgi:hypothetical protein